MRRSTLWTFCLVVVMTASTGPGVTGSIRLRALGALAAPSGAVPSPATEPQAPPDFVFFHQVRVFDGHRFLDPRDVVIRDGKIQGIEEHLTQPAGARVIEGSGMTLLPGLIDAHVHAFQRGSLVQALLFGVTTTLDMFTDIKFAKSIEHEQAQGRDLDLADLRSAGTLVTAPGGHGTEYGMPIPTITDPKDAQAFVDARIAEGSDYIKIIYDDGLEYGTGKAIPTISKETMAAVIAAAHKRGMLTVVHIGSFEQAKDAIEAGADGLAHLFIGDHVDPDFGQFVAAHHAFVVPTLSVLNSICHKPKDALADDPRIQSALSPADDVALKAVFAHLTGMSCAGAEQAVKLLEKAGVPILAGTDAPNPGTVFGASLHGELQLLVEAGLTPTEALEGATSIPAKVFRLPDRGTIAAGMRADLLLVRGDPGADITATRDIVAVWKAGVRDDREAALAKIKQAIEEARSEAKAPPPVGSESGLVSDFEDMTAKANYGQWVVSTDEVAGGKSTAKMEVAAGGANGSKGALRTWGEVSGEVPYAWSGVMFSPGKSLMAPANLSGKKTIRFWAKGDGRADRVMVLTKSGGYVPATQNFTPAGDWKEFSFPLKSFGGTDGHDIIGIVFGAGLPAGRFDLYLDEVHIE
ncbi:MAG TPA: CIA30 family protein [Blastocatellia bacterium]|nr:CIA30 family protein [Blastocatellia bacterium]